MTPAGRHIVVRLTKADHGRQMSLKEFDTAETKEGLLVELADGTIEVLEFPTIQEAMTQDRLQHAIAAYRAGQKTSIRLIAPMGRAKMQIATRRSERHPDLSLYLTDPPARSQPWAQWTPDIVVEIVSESSRRRDYVDKMGDYLQAGVGEYWVIDPANEQIQVCRRDVGKWNITVLSSNEPLTSERLPGFMTTPSAIFGLRTA